jgi:hypothetical protein
MMLDVERLDETCIKKLANEEVLAIRVKGLLPQPRVSKAISMRRASVASAWRFMRRKTSRC